MPHDKKSVRLISDMIDVFDLIDDLDAYGFLVQDALCESYKLHEPNVRKITLLLAVYRDKMEAILPEAKAILQKHMNA